MNRLDRRNVKIAAIVIGIPVIVVAWWLGSPLFLDSEVDEAFPVPAAAEDQTEIEPTTTTQGTTETTTPASTTSTSEQTAGPTTLLTGEFRDADSSHRGTGTATIYELEDGSTLLRFEDFEVTNGPDLHVYLVAHENPMNPEDLGGYLDLGSLKGNIGDQNYEVPDGVDISEFGSVVIYCVPFHVFFS
ncbi:MAG: DM13 domain-containing protein, partial [Acidimicrobiia bacterium]